LAEPQTPTHIPVGGPRAGVPGLIWSVDFSPDGAHVVTGANLTGRIEIVDARTKQPVGHLAGHLQHIMAVKFSRDGKRLASGGHTLSDALKIWDFESRREIMSLSVDRAWSAGQVWRVPSLEEIQERDCQLDSKLLRHVR
jgi:WD40 repeat protein